MFWIISTLLTLVIAGLLALVLMRGRVGAEPAAAYDLRVYRDQLREIERDMARGVIAPQDGERVRAEVARRILAADAAAHEARGGVAAAGPTRIAALALVLGVAAGSLLLYRDLGAPGYGDLGLAQRFEMAEEMRAGRPSQAAAEAGIEARPEPAGLSEDYKALVQQLRDTVAERPDDLTGHRLLARHEAASGNLIAAYTAQSRVVALSGAAATAEDYANLADMMVLAAGGYVSPEAEAALASALERDRRNGVARYYWGLMMAQTGRPDQAFHIWNQLMMESPPDAPWIAPIEAQIEQAAAIAGIRYAPPPPARPAPGRGPSDADIAAARDMTPDDRQAMIRSMVQGLADRLASEGGPPADWARLISALGVLGDTEDAAAIWADARQAFAGNVEALAQIDAAARGAGLGE